MLQNLIIDKRIELRDCKRLWEVCFDDTKAYTEFYFDKKVQHNRMLTISEENKIVAMLHMNPYQLWKDGSIVLSFYIVGVATEPKKRRQGYMRKLLQQMFFELYSKEVPFVYLMPAKRELYEPFGFRYIYTKEKMKLEVKIPKDFKETEVISYHKISQKEKEKAVRFAHNKVKKNFSVCCYRDSAYYEMQWEEMQAAGGDILVFYSHRTICGMISYMWEEEHLEMTELLIEEEKTREILEAFSREMFLHQENSLQTGQVKVCHNGACRMTCLESKFLRRELLGENEIILKEEKQPSIMARVIDLKAFVSHFARERESLNFCNPYKKEQFLLAIRDEQIVENSGTYHFTYQLEGWTVERVKKVTLQELTIEEFSKNLWRNEQVYFNEIT